MISPAEADALIAEHLTCAPIESLPLVQCFGGVLRENVYAERDQPPFDRVAMDGVAIASEAVRAGRRVFELQATQAAGDPPLTLQDDAHAIEIMTGAVLPTGADAVVPVEQLQRIGERIHLAEDVRPHPRQNVHTRGSDGSQGTLLLSTGTRLGGAEIAVAASAGMARVRVSAQPRMIVVSTGNELIEPGEPIEAQQIRRSNAYGLMASLRQNGFQRIADDHLPDDRQLLLQRLRVHLDTYDVVILSGGVSMGKFDLVPQVLQELGVRQVLHKIAQKPGKPLWFGIAASGTAVFGLPGNPVSSLTCLVRYVIPGVSSAMGELPRRSERIALSADVEVKSALAFFMPVALDQDDWGRSWAHPRPGNGSGDFTSLAGTDGFVELPPGPHVYPKGFVTRLHRWVRL